MNDIEDPYGLGEPNNPSAIYMALVFNTDALTALKAAFGEQVMHDTKVSSLALANTWDDPRMDTRKLMGELIGLVLASGADHDPHVADIVDIARNELRKQAVTGGTR